MVGWPGLGDDFRRPNQTVGSTRFGLKLRAPNDRCKDAHLERQQPGTALLTALGPDGPKAERRTVTTLTFAGKPQAV
jgi:hypothetical protein